MTFSENVLRLAQAWATARFLLSTRITVVLFTPFVTWYATSTRSSIHEMVERYRVTWPAPLLVPLAAGLFWKRANNLGAALAIILGLSTWILFRLFVPRRHQASSAAWRRRAHAGGWTIGRQPATARTSAATMRRRAPPRIADRPAPAGACKYRRPMRLMVINASVAVYGAAFFL